jgi:hypothetical protein
MKAWRLMAVVAMAAGIGACATKGSTAKSSDDEVASTKGCPDEDPFCDEADSSSSGSGSTDTPEEGGDEGGESSGSGAGNGGISPFGGGAASDSPRSKDFDLVIAVSRPAPPAAAKDAKAPAKPAKPGPAKLRLHPAGLAFGMSSEQIAKLYDRAFDKAYLELFKKTPIGPQTDALENELTEKKAQLRRSLLEFGNLPTGMDNSPLKGEYTYNNDESMSRIDLGNGIVRNFFFFGDRLWKIYDEHALGAGRPLGTSFESAVTFVETNLGIKAKRVPADFSVGRNFDTAEFSDGTILLRLVNREPTVGVVFIDESVEKKLPTLRKNRSVDPTAVDSSVRSATRPAPPAPGGSKKK